jgi:hypothetical protein
MVNDEELNVATDITRTSSSTIPGGIPGVIVANDNAAPSLVPEPTYVI